MRTVRKVAGLAMAAVGVGTFESQAAGLVCREDGSEAVVSTLPSQGLRTLLRLEFAPARKGDEGTYRLVQLDGKRIRVFMGAAACEIVVEGAMGPGTVATAPTPVQSPTGTTAAAPVVSKEAPRNEPEDKPAAKPAKDAYKPADELSVPSSPAFDIIGATPDLASLPRTPRDLAAQLVAGRAPDGTFQKGVAIDATLGQLLLALPLVDEKHVRSLVQKKVKEEPTVIDLVIEKLSGGVFKAADRDFESRFANRLKFSLATTQEEENPKAPLNLGLGVHYTLWDYADENATCKDERDEKAVQNNSTRTKSGTNEAPSCQEKREGDQRLFGSTAAAVGWARAYQLQDGSWGRRESGARGFWATVATGSIGQSTFLGDPKMKALAAAEARAQMIFHYRNLKDQPFLADADSSSAVGDGAPLAKKQDVSQWAVRIKMGKPHGAASFEYAKANRKVHGEGQLVTSRRAFGLEWKLADSLWLVAAAGRESTSALEGKSQSFVTTNLRYALPDSPK